MSLVRLGEKPPPDFSDPIGFLRACHGRIEQRLATLPRCVEALRSADPGRHAEARVALAAVIVHFDGAAHLHTLDEEASLFCRMQHEIIATLTIEHRAHEAIYLAWKRAAERLVAGETAPQLCDDLQSHGVAMTAAYRAHIQVEEDVLFPAALAALDEKELRAVGLEMRIRRG